MTIEELTTLIDEADNNEWFSQVETPVNFPSVSYSQNIKGLKTLYIFLSTQCEGWDSRSEEEKNYFTPSVNFFNQTKNAIYENINRLLHTDIGTRNSFWNASIVQKFYGNTKEIFLFDSPEVEFLITVRKDYPEAYNGAYNFIVGDIKSNIFERKENLVGTILAYEFALKGRSLITERRKAEQKSLNSFRTSFEKYISEKENFLSGLKKDMAQRLKNQENEFNALRESKITEFDQGKDENFNLFQNWFNEAQIKYETFYDQAVSNKSILENTYGEQLKFQKPADYWKERSIILREDAWKTLKILVAIVTITAFFLGLILWLSPDSILESWYGQDKSPAIRWSLIFISLLSLVAFAVKAISKVMFSSFHLARDCDERYTLTYFYLSLVNESKLDPKDRTLVMQSLFSRSETGLLKEDSSPTMPGSVGSLFGGYTAKPN